MPNKDADRPASPHTPLPPPLGPARPVAAEAAALSQRPRRESATLSGICRSTARISPIVSSATAAPPPKIQDELSPLPLKRDPNIEIPQTQAFQSQTKVLVIVPQHKGSHPRTAIPLGPKLEKPGRFVDFILLSPQSFMGKNYDNKIIFLVLIFNHPFPQIKTPMKDVEEPCKIFSPSKMLIRFDDS